MRGTYEGLLHILGIVVDKDQEMELLLDGSGFSVREVKSSGPVVQLRLSTWLSGQIIAHFNMSQHIEGT